jgi:hypothetical protein
MVWQRFAKSPCLIALAGSTPATSVRLFWICSSVEIESATLRRLRTYVQIVPDPLLLRSSQIGKAPDFESGNM